MIGVGQAVVQRAAVAQPIRIANQPISLGAGFQKSGGLLFFCSPGGIRMAAPTASRFGHRRETVTDVCGKMFLGGMESSNKKISTAFRKVMSSRFREPFSTIFGAYFVPLCFPVGNHFDFPRKTILVSHGKPFSLSVGIKNASPRHPEVLLHGSRKKCSTEEKMTFPWPPKFSFRGNRITDFTAAGNAFPRHRSCLLHSRRKRSPAASVILSSQPQEKKSRDIGRAFFMAAGKGVPHHRSYFLRSLRKCFSARAGKKISRARCRAGALRLRRCRGAGPWP